MGKKFSEALEYLNSLYNFEKDARRRSAPDFHLEAISYVLRDLGEPHRDYRVVHIAGTKGKGSVAAMITAILRHAGMRVGTYTSPHLIDLRERIRIDGAPVDEDLFAEGVFAVRKVIGPRPREYATFFEVLTAAALWIFSRAGVDVAVIEAGLGGRYDATNVVLPEVVVLTRIGLDHTERLGNTIPEIAGDKAQIIKPGCVAVVAPQVEESMPPIEAQIARTGAKGLLFGRDFTYCVVESSLEGTRVVQKMGGEEIEYFVPLVGRFQAENASVSVAAAQTLGVPKDVIAGGIAETRLRGRMEIVSRSPLVIVDGAHNPPAAEATASEIVSLGLAPAVFVVGINRPKDYKNMLSVWARTAKAFVFTDLDNPRAYPPQVLADFAKGLGVAAQTIPDPAEALKRAEQIAGPRGTVFVAGSLYLAGKMLQIFGSKSPA